jgi:hypothetical protein
MNATALMTRIRASYPNCFYVMDSALWIDDEKKAFDFIFKVLSYIMVHSD